MFDFDIENNNNQKSLIKYLFWDWQITIIQKIQYCFICTSFNENCSMLKKERKAHKHLQLY